MTLAEIAGELGLDERTVRRVLEAALAKLRAGAVEFDLEPENFSSTVIATISGVPRRFSGIEGEHSTHVPRAESLPEGDVSSSRGVGQRAGLPRRFPRKL